MTRSKRAKYLGKCYVQEFIAPELGKKKKASGGSEKQSRKCKRAAALVMTWYES